MARRSSRTNSRRASSLCQANSSMSRINSPPRKTQMLRALVFSRSRMVCLANLSRSLALNNRHRQLLSSAKAPTLLRSMSSRTACPKCKKYFTMRSGATMSTCTESSSKKSKSVHIRQRSSPRLWSCRLTCRVRMGPLEPKRKRRRVHQRPPIEVRV